MSNGYYTTLEEEENDPRLSSGTPFDEPPSDFEEPRATVDPFAQTPPPSVKETKAARDPFADDPNDPRLQRIHDLDDQLKNYQGSVGAIFAALSPHGDKKLESLMAQRKMYGNEYHGDMALRRQLESSRLQNESQMHHWDVLQQNNQNTTGARLGGTAEKAREFDNPHAVPPKQFAPKSFVYAGQEMGPDGVVYDKVMDPSTGAISRSVSKGPGARGGVMPKAATPKPTVDPYVKQQAQELQTQIMALQKALTADTLGTTPIQGSVSNDSASNRNKRALIEMKVEQLQDQLKGLYGKNPGPQNSVGASQGQAPATSGGGGPQTAYDKNGTAYTQDADGNWVDKDGNVYGAP